MKLMCYVLSLLACFQAFSSLGLADILKEDRDEYTSYQAVFKAVQAGNWPEAYACAYRTRHKLLVKVLKWIDYIRLETKASFSDITTFVRENPDWPRMMTLLRRAESAITLAEPAANLKEWFYKYPPLTFKGKVTWIRLLYDGGLRDQGVSVAREAWTNDNFSVVQEKHFLTLYGHLLHPVDHIIRLDRLLWERQIDAARRILPKISTDRRVLAEARILLASNRPEADAALAMIPSALRDDDPGLAYERVHWKRKKRLYLEAISLLSSPVADKVRPDMWWIERAVLAREALFLGHVSKAYEATHTRGFTYGPQFAEAEWLAGWIALRWLGDTKLAFPHFIRMYKSVTTPISLSRAAYWAGRTAETMGYKEEAIQWYSKAALHITSYYGQLAAGKLTNNQPWKLPEDPSQTAVETSEMSHHELVNAVTLLHKAGQKNTIYPFIFRVSELAMTPSQHILATDLATRNIGRPDISVTLARRAAQSGVLLITAGYPLGWLHVKEPPEHALILAVIRQESNFHAGAVSTAGALGLMQLMPTTAAWTASKRNIKFTINALTTNPEYNVALGTSLLRDLIDLFKGSYVLAITGYNAGAAQSQRWVKAFGDPHRSLDDAVDWIESIPFSETRNYVQRVLEGIQVYRRRLGLAKELQLSLEEDLQR